MPICYPHLLLFLASTRRLTTLAPIDIAVLALYFVVVIFIGFYVKGSTNTSEEFFLAGREMSAWIAGLIFGARQRRKKTSLPKPTGSFLGMQGLYPRRMCHVSRVALRQRQVRTSA